MRCMYMLEIRRARALPPRGVIARRECVTRRSINAIQVLVLTHRASPPSLYLLTKINTHQEQFERVCCHNLLGLSPPSFSVYYRTYPQKKESPPPPPPRHPRCVKLRPETPQQPNAPRASHSFYTSRSRNTLFTVKAPPTHMPPNTREYPHCRQRLVCSIQVVAAPVFACPLIRRRHTRTPRH